MKPAVCGGVTRMVMSEGAMSKVQSRYRRLARAVIAMFVFAVGALGGAGAAALLMPT
jgi:predicted dinucleotide-utilizing enzyme